MGGKTNLQSAFRSGQMANRPTAACLAAGWSVKNDKKGKRGEGRGRGRNRRIQNLDGSAEGWHDERQTSDKRVGERAQTGKGGA